MILRDLEVSLIVYTHEQTRLEYSVRLTAGISRKTTLSFPNSHTPCLTRAHYPRNRLLPIIKVDAVAEEGFKSRGKRLDIDALWRTHPWIITQMEFGVPPIGLEDSDDTTPDEVAVKNCVTISIEPGLYFGQEKHVRGASPPQRPACPDSKYETDEGPGAAGFALNHLSRTNWPPRGPQ